MAAVPGSNGSVSGLHTELVRQRLLCNDSAELASMGFGEHCRPHVCVSNPFFHRAVSTSVATPADCPWEDARKSGHFPTQQEEGQEARAADGSRGVHQTLEIDDPRVAPVPNTVPFALFGRAFGPSRWEHDGRLTRLGDPGRKRCF